jgi:hypothetical protein
MLNNKSCIIFRALKSTSRTRFANHIDKKHFLENHSFFKCYFIPVCPKSAPCCPFIKFRKSNRVSIFLQLAREEFFVLELFYPLCPCTHTQSTCFSHLPSLSLSHTHIFYPSLAQSILTRAFDQV